MFAGLIDRLKTLFDNAMIPGEVVEVYNMFIDLWECIPFMVRVVLICCLGFACLIAAIKILF